MTSPWRALGAVVPLALAMLALGCRDQAPGSTVTDSTFVRTMVELHRVESDSTIDSMMQDSVRRIVLRRNGVSVEELDRAARALAAEPAHATAVWREIESRSRRIYRPPQPRVPDSARSSP